MAEERKDSFAETVDTAASAAHTVKGAIKAGKAISGAAKGAAAGGPYGAVAGAVWAGRKHIGKIVAVIVILLLLPVLFVLMLPGLIFGSLINAFSPADTEQPVLNSETAIVENANDITFTINSILGEALDDVMARIEADFASSGADQMEVKNPYSSGPVYNANLIISQYCAARDEDFESISLDGLASALREHKEHLYPDEKPKVFAQTGFGGEAVTYPVFYSSREVKELGADATQIRSSRFAGVLLAPTGIFVTYNSGGALMKWRYKSELRVKTLLWNILCQQRLAQQYRVEQVHGLVLGDSMDLAYQILTSTGGAKHDYFMLDGSYDHFYFLTNDHQGEVILALLCDPVKTAELDRILSQGLYAGNPGRAMEQDAAEPDGTPVLFGYFCDLPRIVRFNTALELMERPGTLICFDFQADVLRRYCSDRVHLQTIDFTKFEGRLFP